MTNPWMQDEAVRAARKKLFLEHLALVNGFFDDGAERDDELSGFHSDADALVETAWRAGVMAAIYRTCGFCAVAPPNVNGLHPGYTAASIYGPEHDGIECRAHWLYSLLPPSPAKEHR